MPAVTRKGDQCTGHDSCPGVPLVSYSPDVFANSLHVGRVGDTYESHGCVVHPSHADNIAQGSPTVFANSIPWGRVGDAVNIGGSVAEGSPNVFSN